MGIPKDYLDKIFSDPVKTASRPVIYSRQFLTNANDEDIRFLSGAIFVFFPKEFSGGITGNSRYGVMAEHSNWKAIDEFQEMFPPKFTDPRICRKMSQIIIQQQWRRKGELGETPTIKEIVSYIKERLSI